MDINVTQILFQLINFSVVVGAVSYLLYKPVLKVLEERSLRIEEAQKAAKKTIQEKERIAQIEKKTLKEADKKAAKIVEDARKSAKQTEAQAIKKAKELAEKEREKSLSTWETEKKQLIKEIKAEYTASIIAATKKVITADLDVKKHQKIIDEQLSKLVAKL